MRLIDADEAREKMLKLLDHHLMMCNYSADSATQDCIEVISEATVVDAEPVRHGHWNDEGRAYNGDYLVRCCVCRRSFSESKQIGYVRNYCPNCGAKMDEVSE